MRRCAPLILIALLLAGEAMAWQIVEFCPDTYLPNDADEYIVLEGNGTLDGYFISDGEGSVRFPGSTRADGRIVVAREGDAFCRTHSNPPDFELFNTRSEIPDAIRVGRFQLANTADELILYQGATVLQKVSWPADLRAREGQVHYFENGIWDPRPLFLGQTRLEPFSVSNVTLVAFVSPDSAYPAFAQAIGGAKREILVNVYLFTNGRQAEELTVAAGRGVQVRVLIEGGPVGGIPAEGSITAGLLMRSDIPVLQMKKAGDTRKRYRFNHAKYMVIDREAVFITSENFDPNGFPREGERGNRGWGVYIRSPEMAGYFADLFLADSMGYDISPAEPIDGEIPYFKDTPYTPEFPAISFTGANITAVISPDTSRLINDLLEDATSSIEIEQAYIQNWSGNSPNPYLEAALNAARRGVRVRILLDSYWFNTEGEMDNDEMVPFLRRVARGEDLPLEARLASLSSSGIEKIHNKGVIVDGRRVLISSINWNENSPLYNREAGVIIESPEVARYFLGVFEDDWRAAESDKAKGPDMLKIGVAAAVVFLLLLQYLVNRRR
ncbi:MAG: phospholipase D-like domain-containing protein [Methanomicrobiales archaeon]|nr:phospholipase D-like domain-containing protein [Methanomicrobiales archaeon]